MSSSAERAVPAGPSEPTDPFDLDALRSKPLDEIVVERVLLTVPVRKPGRNEFFRVHSSPDYVVDSLVLETEDGLDRTVYWIAPSLWGELCATGDAVSVRLFTCISKRGGTVFLWPAKLPREEGAGRRWHVSGLEISEIAKRQWVKMKGDRDLGAYVPYVAGGNLGGPTWPDKTYDELVKIAFKDRVIDSLDHDVLRRLRGAL